MPSQPADVLRPTPHEPVSADASPRVDAEPSEALVEQDLLVEDVSIDGMCGVY